MPTDRLYQEYRFAGWAAAIVFMLGCGASPPQIKAPAAVVEENGGGDVTPRGDDEPLHPKPAAPVKAASRPLKQFAPSSRAAASVRVLRSSPLSEESPTASPDKPAERKVIIQTPHLHAVQGLAFHPSGRFLASVSNDCLLKIWDLRTGRLFHTLTGASAPLYAVAYSPDGRWLVAGGADKLVHVWNAQTLKREKQLPGHSNRVTDLAFSGDGSLLASCSKDKFVILWDFAELSPIQTLEHPLSVSGVSLSADGKLVASVDGATLRVWNASDGAEIFRTPLEGSSDRVAFNADNSVIYAGVVRSRHEGNSELITNVLETVRETVIVELATKKVRRIADRFLDCSLPDGSLLCLEEVGRLSLRDPATGAANRKFETAGAPSPKEVIKSRNQLTFSDFYRWHAPDESTRISPDGRLAASRDQKGYIGIWDTATGREVRTLGVRADVPYGLGGGNLMKPLLAAWSPTAPVLAVTGMDGNLRLIDLRIGLAPRVAFAHEGSVTALAFAPDGRSLATSGQDHKIQLWDVNSQGIRRTLDCEKIAGTVQSLAFSPDGKRLACGHQFSAHGNGCTTLWMPETGEKLGVLHDGGPAKGPKHFLAAGTAINGVAFWNNGASLLMTRGMVSRLGRFDVAKLEQTHAVAIGEEQIHALAIPRVGKLFAVAYGRSKHLDLITLTFPDNAVLVMGEGEGANALLRGYAGGCPTCLDFSPNSKQLACGQNDGVVVVWDLKKQEEVVTFQGHDVEVDSVSYSHEGKFLASAGRDMTVRVWDLEAKELVASIVAFEGAEYVAVTRAGYYTSSRDALATIALRSQDGVMPMDLFDATLNRPDRVLEALGYAPAETLALYRAACERRIRRLGLSAVVEASDMHPPTIALSGVPPASTAERTLTLRISAASPDRTLAKLKTFVNDVPVGLADGESLATHKAAMLEAEIEVPLGAGVNKIQIMVADDQGVESLPVSLETTCLDTAKPQLFVASLGVSDYNDPKLRLQFAAKDASDVAAAFKQTRAGCLSEHVFLRKDKEVSQETLAEARQFFDRSTVDDVAILFIAGHGLLDSKMDYWFATHDVNRKKPGLRGIAFAELEALLDGVPARRRLLLIDTCHAGEADDVPDQATEPGVTADINQVAEVLQTMFVDLRRGTGTTIIAAATSEGRAFEDKSLKNGYFTQALLQGLLQGDADRDGNQKIKVSELRDYIMLQVPKLSKQKQQPRIRRENAEYDFSLN